jgi:hypothetical protein
MGKKIFVSYKYSDNSVFPINKAFSEAIEPTTVRHYVNELQNLLADDDNINQGEKDGESLAHFKDSTIESRLRSKIYHSSITIVMISPNMIDLYTPESDQWIPWEISYSLREVTRTGRVSGTNAVLAIVLPDRSGSYSYFLEEKTCCESRCTMHVTNNTFQIIRDNMFNSKNLTPKGCNQSLAVFTGEYSYIPAVKWIDFKSNISGCLDRVVNINANRNSYDIVKTVK